MIKLYLWDVSGNYTGEVEADPYEAIPSRCTPEAPKWVQAHRNGNNWVEGWVAIPQAPTDSQTLRDKLAVEYERRMQAIAAGYPPSERESWPVQTSEAYDLLSDSTASTPWIDAAAGARGLERLELARRIAAKDLQYRVISGTLSGIRQRIEDQIDQAGTDPVKLSGIDVTDGWP